MSFSFRLPEEDKVCECKYDEAHDRMDKQDCAFHCDIVEDSASANVSPAERKPQLCQRPTRSPIPDADFWVPVVLPTVNESRNKYEQFLGTTKLKKALEGMKIQYDSEVDVLSIVFSENLIEMTDEEKPGVFLDYDKNGNIVGIWILDASTRIGNPTLIEYNCHSMRKDDDERRFHGDPPLVLPDQLWGCASASKSPPGQI